MEQIQYCINQTANRNKRSLNEIIAYNSYAEIVLYDYKNNEINRSQIDIWNIDRIKAYKWYLGHDGYVRNGDKPKYLHRIIMNCVDGDVIDHIDNNPLNNMINNLRYATNSQNMMNRGIQKNNTSGTTGVVWHNKHNKWMAQIKINGKNIYLGSYSDLNKAIEARKNAELLYFKEFRNKKGE